MICINAFVQDERLILRCFNLKETFTTVKLSFSGRGGVIGLNVFSCVMHSFSIFRIEANLPES